jgi:hypothetical protein
MNLAFKTILAGASALVLSASAASAAIICNSDGDCWHARHHREYKPELRLHVYPDTWRWREADSHRYHWREHDGEGYWRGGVWIKL